MILGIVSAENELQDQIWIRKMRSYNLVSLSKLEFSKQLLG